MKLFRFYRNRRAFRKHDVVSLPLVAVRYFTFEDSQRDVGEVVRDVIVEMHAREICDEKDVRVVRPGVNVLLYLVQFVSKRKTVE